MTQQPLDLQSAWWKFKRGSDHLDTLQSQIIKAGFCQNEIPITQSFEPQENAIIYRIDSSIEIGDDWPLLIGDSLFNFRSALDHLAWQLAIRKLGGEKAANRHRFEIQFPIFSQPCPGHDYWKNMTDADRVKVEQFQPYNFVPTMPGETSLLKVLSDLNNFDKHRRVHVAIIFPRDVWVGTPILIGCDFALDSDGNRRIEAYLNKPAQPGDIIARIHIVPHAGFANPHVDLQPSLAGHIAFNDFWNVVDTLDSISRRVADILDFFR